MFLAGVFGLAAGRLAKFVQTVFMIHPSQGRWHWYFVPAYPMMALTVPVLCYVAIYFIRRFISSRSNRTSEIVRSGVVLCGAGFLFSTTDFTGTFRSVVLESQSNNISGWHVGSYAGTLVMNWVFSDDSVVGSWDAGVIGHFSRFPVINLEGLTNSYSSILTRQIRAGTEKLA